MCVNLMSMQQMLGSTDVERGGSLQAIGGAANALGDLAAGVTRARMNRADARDIEAAGDAKAGRIRQAGARELSTARAQASATGVKLSSGSIMEVERQIVRNVEQDAGVAILTAHRQADSLRQSAGYYQQAGINAAGDGLVGAVSKWKKTRRPGSDGPLIDYTKPTPQAGY
jgi:hypothetical protein